MKKKTKLLISILVFIISYLFITFGIPGMRIKLEAEPMEYFIESLKSAAVFKTVVSLLLSVITVLLFKER